MWKGKRPELNLLDEEIIVQILEEAKEILSDIGILIENENGIELLKEKGIKINNNNRAFIPNDIIENSLKEVPSQFSLYDREGEKEIKLGGNNICFNPGSSALTVLDKETNEIRKAITKDYVEFTKVVDQMEHIKAQSTAIICSDVPDKISDSYRLYLSLLFSKKPIITGTFSKESFNFMKEILIAVRGDKNKLRNKPLAIFDACPSAPLQWSDLTCQSIIDAAYAGIPSEFVSMPLTGANAPVTLLGSIVQHTAETLAGVVITQLVSKCSPIIWGGSPAAFDMRKATTPMGSIDTMLLDVGYVEVGKYLNIPTHAYLGMSDTKVLDAQCGFETGMGMLLAATKGINMISGAGMLNFETTQSIQKLIVDNEICGMCHKFNSGIAQRDKPIAKELLSGVDRKSQFLTHDHTLKWFRKELHMPSSVIDRSTNDEWIKNGKKNIGNRSRETALNLISKYSNYISDEISDKLKNMMEQEAMKIGKNELPKLN